MALSPAHSRAVHGFGRGDRSQQMAADFPIARYECDAAMRRFVLLQGAAVPPPAWPYEAYAPA
jgi:hypothetical protein